MSDLSKPVQARVLNAAKLVFARYGFRKASMEDIAREAGVSRPSLYQWYGNKRAVLQALAEAITGEALQAADAAWPDGAPLAVGLAAAILAKDLPLFRLLHGSPHGAELLAVDTAMTALIATRLQTAFAALLTAKLGHVPGVDLMPFGGATGFGTIIVRLADGLKTVAADEADYVDCVERLCRIVAFAGS